MAPRQSEGLATIGSQPFFIALVHMEGLERARIADEADFEKRPLERRWDKLWKNQREETKPVTKPTSIPTRIYSRNRT